MIPGGFLFGETSVLVQLHDRTISKNGPTGTVSCGYRLNHDGNVYSLIGVVFEQWLLLGLASEYEARATLISGGPLDGGDAVGVWQTLTTDQTWSVSASGGNSTTATIYIEIRDAVTLQVVAHATVIMTATNTGGTL